MDINTLENPHKQVTEGFILGDPDFVDWVKETFIFGPQGEKEVPQLKKLKPRIGKVKKFIFIIIRCEPPATPRKNMTNHFTLA